MQCVHMGGGYGAETGIHICIYSLSVPKKTKGGIMNELTALCKACQDYHRRPNCGHRAEDCAKTVVGEQMIAMYQIGFQGGYEAQIMKGQTC